jgi:hypothetical protein
MDFLIATVANLKFPLHSWKSSLCQFLTETKTSFQKSSAHFTIDLGPRSHIEIVLSYPQAHPMPLIPRPSLALSMANGSPAAATHKSQTSI